MEFFKKLFKGSEQAPKSESPLSVIRVGEKRDLLAQKLAEYKQRLDGFKPPETQFDTIYKIAIVEELLNTGEVDTAALSKKLKEKYNSLNVALFDNACAVVDSYIKDEGARVRGGTGFPKEEGK